ncbi:RhoGAP-domain-containing protein [Rhodofomes roseus]|uniref:RhoGAP-domain-containing protein n=1 Tax=Rhodofomes roseus TaxID=34475 RepID=A0ABQ8KMG8_9APHY|nr:RhoGAP-domain-containing protein [Rhodofomes roseus]KAH9839288.1 RhoGAP-domain-containing protein [Rhodofomes roseus]
MISVMPASPAMVSTFGGDGSGPPDPSLLNENRFCPGCKKSVIDENGGVVVAFGQSFFHVDCFKCAKCGNQVTADTNLLLLSDGSPICANCSYSCNVCRLPILDEAIMTGDDSYHAHCFKCKVCKNRIDELVFAKTSQGIYCMNCHNQRVARSRRHAQRQREKEREREREREKAASVLMSSDAANSPLVAKAEQSASTNAAQSPSQVQSPSVSSEASTASPSAHPPANGSASHRGSMTSLNLKQANSHVPDEPRERTPSTASRLAPQPASLSISKRPSTAPNGDGPAPAVRSATLDLARPPLERLTSMPTPRMDSLAVPGSDGADRHIQARKSFDGGVRPAFQQQLRSTPSAYSLNAASGSGSSALNIPNGETSRRDKRQSINPALAQSFSGTASPARGSPQATSPLRDAFGSQRPFAESTGPEHPAFTRVASSSRPSTPSSPRNSLDQGSQISRARSGSSGVNVQRPSEQDRLSRAPSRSRSTLNSPASRSSSRVADHLTFQPQSADRPEYTARTSSLRSHEHRRPPSLVLPDSNIRHQRSFDDRARASPMQETRPSNGTLEVSSRPPSIPTPTSPSHRVDVPRGVESGTDTEPESEDAHRRPERDVPPTPPPKEPPSARSGRPALNRLNTGSSVSVSHDTADDSRPNSEDATVESPESSPVERTSHATFIAPALPPIRISMGGSDFSELLKSVGGDVTKLEQLAEVTESGSRELDLTATSPQVLVQSKRDSMQLLTPRSDVTITESTESRVDDTPAKRPSPGPRQRGMSGGIGGTMSSSLSSISSSMTTDVLSRFPSVPRARPSLDRPSPVDEFSASLEATFGHEDLNASALAPTRITINSEDGTMQAPPQANFSDSLRSQLQDKLAAATDLGNTQITLDVELVQTLLTASDQQQVDHADFKRRLDGMKRASQQYMDGLTVAQTEYDRELKARRDAEAEVTRLRILLSGQAARLSAISGETKRQEAQKQLSEELSNNLSSLGRSVSQLKVERDMTLAEVEQLSASKSSNTPVEGEDGAASLGRALSMRFDNIKNKYQTELVPLTEQREALMREITVLRASRDAYLEETTALNARNEQLAQLNSQYVRRIEAAGFDSTIAKPEAGAGDGGYDRARQIQNLSSSVTSSTVALSDEGSTETSKFIKISKPESGDSHALPTKMAPKFLKWPGHKTTKENGPPTTWSDAPKVTGRKEHVFQQVSVLRVARCDHCGDKMWGSQFRCTSCNIAVHTRCLQHVHLPCTQQSGQGRDEPSLPPAPLPPSMFGRDLIEQIQSESKDEPRLIPVIVEKCVEAVDALALDFEGIYRKTGGSGQSKTITQLFERADYGTFDLLDTERFNDICSVTSVLKSYLRQLPNPLLTQELHAQFMSAAGIRDPEMRSEAFISCVVELPKEHYYTARHLLLHLHRVSECSDRNLMNAQNLGVVFGPTLMRSREMVSEFADMGGKATCVQWLVENAPIVFEHPISFD